MVESLNRILERSFTPQGIKWRYEAWRSGRPVAEIALKYSLIYRVEHVFLIHRETGLPLYSVGSEEGAATDNALMSSMLTAIQDFVRDSFRVDETQGLDSFEVGDFQVWIERGRRALLAVAVRGEPPQSLRSTMSDALDEIHASMGPRLERFAGDTGPFELTRPILEACLESEFAGGKRGLSPLTYFALAAAALAVVGWFYFSLQERRQWNAYLERLDAEPGVVVLESGKRDGQRTVSLLRDEAAADPSAIASEQGIATARIRIETEPYISLDPAMTLRRAMRRFEPPAVVTLTADSGVLRATGAAPLDWVRRFVEQGPSVPGVARVEAGDLLRASLRRLSDHEISFAVASSTIEPAERPEVERLAQQVRDGADAARALGAETRFEITGSADESGTPQINRRLSQARADRLLGALVDLGVERSLLSAANAVRNESRSRTARIEVSLDGEALR